MKNIYFILLTGLACVTLSAGEDCSEKSVCVLSETDNGLRAIENLNATFVEVKSRYDRKIEELLESLRKRENDIALLEERVESEQKVARQATEQVEKALGELQKAMQEISRLEENNAALESKLGQIKNKIDTIQGSYQKLLSD